MISCKFKEIDGCEYAELILDHVFTLFGSWYVPDENLEENEECGYWVERLTLIEEGSKGGWCLIRS